MNNDDNVIDRLIAQRDRLFIENEKLKKALASSCDEQRHELWEAGPGIGGCERAVDAEREVESLTKALAQCRDVFPFIDPPSNLALEAVAFPESVPKYVAEEVKALRAELDTLREKRIPLTDEQVMIEFGCQSWSDIPYSFRASIGFERGVRFAERAHGIGATRAESKEWGAE